MAAKMEFEIQILSLSKLLVDSLNEKGIRENINFYEKSEGSVSILEKFFDKKKVFDYEESLKFLRNLQNLRSTSTAHRKGKRYDKSAREFGIGGDNYYVIFEKIINKAIEFIDYLGNRFNDFSEENI